MLLIVGQIAKHHTRYSGKHLRLHTIQYASFFSAIRQALCRDLKPPIPTAIASETIHHGKKRVDKFAWMEQLNHPQLGAYIHAENEYSRQALKKHRFLQRIILREMKQCLRTNKVLPPLKTVAHGYEYYSSTSSHGMVYLRKSLAQGRDAAEEVLLDSGFLRAMNISIRKVLLSPDHAIFAYNTEREGMEYGELHLKDLNHRDQWTNEILTDVFNFVWANNDTIYYTVPNAQLRPYRVYAHRIGTSQEDDILVYEEMDDTAFVDITSTKDMKYVTINSNTLSSSEVRVIDASHDYTTATLPKIQLIEPRREGVEYYVDHHQSNFYILTNVHGATNFKLVRTHDTNMAMSHWEDVIQMKPTEKIEDVDLFQNNIVIYGRRDGLPMILCYDVHTQETHSVPLTEKFCVLCPGTNQDFNTDTFRFSFTSPFHHESTYEYDMRKRQLKPIRVQTVRGFDRNKYTCTQVHAKSHDGKEIPVTLIHQKNIQLNSRNPVLMRSYGAYGVATDPDFRIEHFPLLERGWVIALAHVRGGSELGRDWYEEGKLQNKMNSFRDFSSVAEHLIQNKLTAPQYMAGLGTSAGGLLVGAMTHMKPELFKALVLRVPFVDPLSAMLNPELPLTQVEYPEWGNPSADKKAYELIEKYSPYENINSNSTMSSLPSLLVTGGMKDQRVQYWQPLKFVARLRQVFGEKSNKVLLKMDLDRGHFGGGTEQDVRLQEAAEQVAFLISEVQEMRKEKGQ